MRKRMRQRKWSGARRTRSCAEREMVVERKWLRHRENVHRVGARPELIDESVGAGHTAFEDDVAAIVRRFLFVFFLSSYFWRVQGVVPYVPDGLVCWRAGAAQSD